MWGELASHKIHVHVHCTVEDKKTFPFDVLQNGTVCIVVRFV